jgi:hypothetical protein
MGIRIRALLVAIGIALPALGFWTLSSGPLQGTPVGPGSPAEPKPLALVGTATCSSRGCHGRLEPSDPGTESASHFSYTTWCRHDKHADSYRVLSSEPSVQIAERLQIKNASKAVRCLACHTNPRAATGTTAEAAEEWQFGVGCEACHGPAENWLGPHKSDRWQTLSEDAKRKEYATNDMIWLHSLETRARVCAGCHVGAPADPTNGLPLRDVNHDLIAAGHPRLLFELGAYQANMPKHWVEKGRTPSFEVQTWEVGQLVSAEAAVALLADRADRKSPWPEFAEHDCYACHHGLNNPSWRQSRTDRSGPGLPWMGSWNYALLPLILGPADKAQEPVALQNLKKAMRPLNPNREEIGKQAAGVLATLKGQAVKREATKFDTSSLLSLRRRLAEHAMHAPSAEWDEMEQVYLALVAVNHAYHERRQQPADGDEQIDEAIHNLGQKLAFRTGQNSPAGFRQTAKWEADLKALLEQIR